MTAGPLQPGSRIAGCRLLRLLGAGTQSQVFLAEEEAPPQRAVALKLARLPGSPAAAEEAAASLHASARAAAALPPHPGIAAVWAHGTEWPWAWVAMEPVPGAGLDRYTHVQRLLPEPLVLQLGERIAHALAHAHRHGLVHRDLKPANVLVHWGQDSVRLVDFGLARNADASFSATGMLLGTPAYMAPEQLAGVAPDARSDLYALGVMLFELLAGARPHHGESLGELLNHVVNRPPTAQRTLRPDLPPAPAQAVEELLQRLLARRPEDRLADAGEAAAALRALAAGWPGGTGSGTGAPPAADGPMSRGPAPPGVGAPGLP